jgi:hypothetical protein
MPLRPCPSRGCPCHHGAILDDALIQYITTGLARREDAAGHPLHQDRRRTAPPIRWTPRQQFLASLHTDSSWKFEGPEFHPCTRMPPSPHGDLNKNNPKFKQFLKINLS